MQLSNIITKFSPISLSEMDAVKLMNRTDRKYWFAASLLPELLADIQDNYYLLEVDGERNLPYATTYYDTPEDQMYNNHHRGKKNRYKIRRRNYISTDSSFLEIKFKSNKGRTVKVRKASKYGGDGFDEVDRKFISEKSPYQTDELQRVLENGFNRLMLVSKAMNERCTIDSSLKFAGNESSAQLDDLVIVEVKTDGRSHSAIIDALNARRLKPSGFSKYCIGRSLTDSSVKINNFKVKHRVIDKVLNKI
ncbi:MAG: polyphosphate polymerase domain-containing protein [Rikenellaceae bacterium]